MFVGSVKFFFFFFFFFPTLLHYYEFEVSFVSAALQANISCTFSAAAFPVALTTVIRTISIMTFKTLQLCSQGLISSVWYCMTTTLMSLDCWTSSHLEGPTFLSDILTIVYKRVI